MSATRDCRRCRFALVYPALAKRFFKEKGTPFSPDAAAYCAAECPVIGWHHVRMRKRYLRQSEPQKDLFLLPHPSEAAEEDETPQNVILGPWENRPAGRAG